MRILRAVAFCCALIPTLAAVPAPACTTFCMKTPDGPVFGSNLDLFIPGDGLVFVNRRGIAKRGYSAGTTGAVAEWVSTYGSVTFNIAGLEFAFGGMNEAGLVVGGMELRAGEYAEPDERPPVGNGTWVQYVLDTCGSVAEVLRVDSLIRIEDSVPPNHFLVADTSGDCAAIEWLDGRFVICTGDDLPVKAMANMRCDRSIAAWERGGPRWWWSNPGQSAERVAAAHERSERYDPERDGDAVAYALETLTRVVAAPHTKWSIVYDIPNRAIRFRSAVSPAVKHLSFDAFDFSCDAPTLMLDVNADLEGDVASAFEPYDHEINLALFRTLCARFGIELSEEGALEIVRLFEGFDCEQ